MIFPILLFTLSNMGKWLECKEREQYTRYFIKGRYSMLPLPLVIMALL